LKLRAQLLDNASDFMFLRDLDGNFVYVNETALKTLGYSREEFLRLKLNQATTTSASARDSLRKELMEKGTITYETGSICKDGSIIPSEVHSRLIEVEAKKLVLSTSRDITERKKAEVELKLRAQLLDNANDSIFLHDFDGNFVYINETMCKSHGYSREELMNMKLPALVIPEYARLLGQQYQDLIEKGYDKFESAHFHKDGSIIPMEIHSRLIELENRKFILTIARDITERKKFENAIKQLAYHDPLTGLPNRILFKDHVTLALAHAARYNNKLALMVMDLDKFKEINDTLGHDAGDQLLRDVGSRLLSTVRKTDTVSRMGGDEFVLLISEIINEEDAANVAQKILETIRKPFTFKRHKLNITPSIGVAVYPKDGKNIDTLTRHADFAMYHVKQGRQNGYLRYMPNMSIKASRKRSSSFKKPQTQKSKP
jgi:diguanylate cyclase (GGDEF)-like protein/PAS domain S-box-containing protein